MITVVGIDPGEVTGLVVAGVEGRAVTKIMHWGEYRQQEATNLIYSSGPVVDRMVCEAWRPRGGPYTFKPFSLEIIGLTRWVGWWFDVPLTLQAPEMKERFHKPALELFPDVGRGGGGHARDALAHVIGWAATRKEL